jgi:type I restriction enzyme S subunit
MEMKIALKQTQMGITRGEWRKCSLKEITSEIGDGIHATPNYSTLGRYPFINGNNLRNGRIVITEDTKSVDESEFRAHQKNLNDNSIMMSINGTIGNLALYAGEKLILGKSASYINVKPEVSRVYVYYTLQIEQTRRQFFDGLTGSTIGNLGLATIRNATISLPPTKAEQEAIAEALSDADALIESLEQLLAKKRHLKQGAMQELLTGKKRLPGFSGEWEVKRIGDVFTISAGRSKSGYIVNGGFYWIVDMGSVSRDGRLIVSKSTNYQDDFLALGDLVMPKDDIGGGNIICKVAYINADKTYVLGDHVYCLRTNSGNPRFLSYVINSHQINTALRKRVIGSAQLGIGRRSVEQQEIPFPELPEQSAINTILSDMDNEVATLESKLTKARDMKRGMMQELLAGRIRLV